MNVKLPHVSFFLRDSASYVLLIFWLDFFSLPFPFPPCSHPIRLSPSASSLLRFLFPVLFFFWVGKISRLLLLFLVPVF